MYKAWAPVIAGYGGEIQLWMEQSKALKGMDTKGACHVIALDWINSQVSLAARNNFVGRFWSPAKDADGSRIPYIPSEYIEKNVSSNIKLNLSEAALGTLEAKLAELDIKLDGLRKSGAADDDGRVVDCERKISQTREQCRILALDQYGGPHCDDIYWTGDYAEIVKRIRYTGGSIYYLLGMRPAVGSNEKEGHTVAFGYRRDSLEADGRLPKSRRQYLDANFGLIDFSESAQMADFFSYLLRDATPSYGSLFGRYLLCTFREFLPENRVEQSGREERKEKPQSQGAI
jgi:hypothetical protein